MVGPGRATVTSLEFRDRLARRTRRAKAHLTLSMLEPLEAYFRLLMQWNGRINLTALPLESPTDETFDRLLVEPLAAARHVLDAPSVWFDLGSGGGSPAIPLKIARPALKLTMIESKTRKAAFLREAIRAVGISQAVVLSERFENVAVGSGTVAAADLVTVRAVKVDAELFDTAGLMLKEGGRLLLFRSSHVAGADPSGFTRLNTVKLTDEPATHLSTYQRVFHVEQRR
jgi:16S rRNA (guanine527-N7)-methyltransferase